MSSKGRACPPLVIVTRPSEQSKSFEELLRAKHYEVLALPLIEAQYSAPNKSDQEIVGQLKKGHFQWVVFSSENAARGLSQWNLSRLPSRAAAVGPRTAEVVKELFQISEVFTPPKSSGAELGKALLEKLSSKENVLLVAAEEGRRELEEALKSKHLQFSKIVPYKTVSKSLTSNHQEKLRSLDPHKVVVTFFSPSALRAFIEKVDVGAEFLKKSLIGSIGPTTTQAVREAGLQIAFEAGEQSEEGMLNAIQEFTHGGR